MTISSENLKLLERRTISYFSMPYHTQEELHFLNIAISTNDPYSFMNLFPKPSYILINNLKQNKDAEFTDCPCRLSISTIYPNKIINWVLYTVEHKSASPALKHGFRLLVTGEKVK